MRLRWYILAALAGALATFVVWEWPQGPMWRSGPGAGTVEGFATDGRTLITSIVTHSVGMNPDPVVCRWDAESGRLLTRVDMPCANANANKDVRPSLVGNVVLVAEGAPVRYEGAPFDAWGGGNWYLHDAVSGKRLSAALSGMRYAPWPASSAFSPDGKWVYGISGEIASITFPGGVVIFSTINGETIIDLPNRNGLKPIGVLFAPDGTTAAVDWILMDLEVNPAVHTVQIIELPSGRERQRLQLPPRHWESIEKWDGRRLMAIERAELAPTTIEDWRACIFDLSKEPVTEAASEPLLHGRVRHATTAGNVHWIDGPNWVAYLTEIDHDAKPSWLQRLVNSIADNFGLDLGHTRWQDVNVRLVDRTTGVTRYELPRPVNKEIRISDDGRRIACPCGKDTFAVWVSDLPSRWPAALLSGAAAAFCILALGRWRRRRERARTLLPPTAPSA